jgi:hypothetical protein
MVKNKHTLMLIFIKEIITAEVSRAWINIPDAKE